MLTFEEEKELICATNRIINSCAINIDTYDLISNNQLTILIQCECICSVQLLPLSPPPHIHTSFSEFSKNTMNYSKDLVYLSHMSFNYLLPAFLLLVSEVNQQLDLFSSSNLEHSLNNFRFTMQLTQLHSTFHKFTSRPSTIYMNWKNIID